MGRSQRPVTPAFSLVELLIVLGLIAGLVAVLATVFATGTESALAVRCQANLKSLVTAVTLVNMAEGEQPRADSEELMHHDTITADGELKGRLEEKPGWISWFSNGAYGAEPESSPASPTWRISTYLQDSYAQFYCLTNGTLWRAGGQTSEIYVCPKHRRCTQPYRPAWSYVMNEQITAGRHRAGSIDSDRLLIFAELQFVPNDQIPYQPDEQAGPRYDPVLNYSGNNGGEREVIGANHVIGKGLCAQVAFGDGHVERIQIPSQKRGTKSWQIKVTKNNLEELTTWLCEAQDVTFSGTKFERLQ